MYSTQKNITLVKPGINEDAVCGKYLFYPDRTGKRKVEGGLRLNNKYKQGFSDKPLITVVTTVLNQELFIEKAICSVLSQRYDNIEYIIVDAASTDKTLNAIMKYNDSLDYYFSEPDSGLYEGINKGLSLATGDYILILNSDDWYKNDCIEMMVRIIQDKQVDLVSALAIETDFVGNTIRRIPLMPLGENVRMRMPLRHETMLISKEIYNKVGYYDESYNIIADLKLCVKIFEEIKTFFQIPEFLMFFRKIGIASCLTPQLLQERKRLLSEHFPFLAQVECEILANEYTKNISDYKNLISVYSDKEKFIKSVKGFLSLHGALKLL